jgi:hypothetical protein
MPTNLTIDDELLEKARIIGKHKTKKAIVTEALKEYIEKRNQIKIFELFGSVVYEPGFDYKAQRKAE